MREVHELHLFVSPTRDELEWAAGATDGEEYLLTLLLMLKSHQRVAQLIRQAGEVPRVRP
ncbi:hypothetical protein GTU99_04590 [Streptomyces sp. PRKS01-65]|nr:hypothetical protein [Streptomyces harenosi]